MIHVDDIAGAMPLIFNRAEAGTVYLGVDDAPVLRSEFYAWLAEKFKIPCNAQKNLSLPSEGKRCANRRLKSLGYSFKYPTFRDGYSGL